jgi:hypothetical protein
MLIGSMLSWYGSYGGGYDSYSGRGRIGDFLTQWQDAGIFSVLLPFLLIFVLVFGILEKTKLFNGKNKSINPLIGFVVSLMAIQFEFVSEFFSVIFPKLGVALAVILVLLILLGIFMPKESWVTYSLIAISAIILVIVLIQTAGDLGWSAGYWWYENWSIFAGGIFILIIFGVIIASSKDDRDRSNFDDSASPFLRDLFRTR